MSLEIPFGITPTNPVYVEAYRGPYDTVLEALSTVPQAVRVLGQVVFVEGVGEYWWKDSVADAGLIEKTSGSSFPFNLESNITGAQFSLITANYGVDLNVPLFLIRNETSVDLINTKADLIIGAGNLNGDLEAKTRNILGHNNVNLDVAGEDLVVVGSNNIKNSTGDRLIVIGNNNQPIATSGDDVLIGNSIFNSASTSSGFNIALGTSAGAGFESVSFGNNIIGAYAAYLGTGALGGYNNLIGAVAYSVNDIGSNNNLMGYLVAQNAVSIDDHNILIGSFVAQNVNNITKYNTFIGYKVAQDATEEGIIGSNEWNTGIGALALENADLSSLDLTTAIGASSMKYAGGESNTAVGRASGWEMKGGYNTALGSRSGKSSDSNISTFLDGASNGDGTDYTGQRSTFIGYDSGYEAVAAALNDMLVIGTYLGSEQGATYISAIGNLYLISNTGTSEVKLKFPNVYGQPNQVLTDVLGNGELSWQDTASLNDTAISSNSTWSSDKISQEIADSSLDVYYVTTEAEFITAIEAVSTNGVNKRIYSKPLTLTQSSYTFNGPGAVDIIVDEWYLDGLTFSQDVELICNTSVTVSKVAFNIGNPSNTQLIGVTGTFPSFVVGIINLYNNVQGTEPSSPFAEILNAGSYTNVGFGGTGTLIQEDYWKNTNRLRVDDSNINTVNTWSSDKINSSFQSIGGKRLRKVESIIDATTYPLTVTTGDRYILGTQTPIDSQWGGGIANQIAEYNGTSWDFTTPEEGNNTFVDSEDKDARFVDDGTPAWELESGAITLFNGNGTTYDSINNKYDLGGTLTQDTTIDLDSNEFNLVNLELLNIVSPTGAGISIEESFDTLRFGTGDGNGLNIEGGTTKFISLATSDGSKVDLEESQAVLSLSGDQVIVSLDSTGARILDNINNNFVLIDGDGIGLTDFSNNSLSLNTNGIRLVDAINNVQIRTNAGGLLLEGDYTSGLTANNLITKDYLDTQLGNISGGSTDLTYVPSTRELQSSTGSNVTLPLVVANGDDGLILGTDKQKLDGIQASAQVNVQSDWNATSGDAFIQNKPTPISEATQAEALALTETDLRSWSPDLIGQAIDSKLTQIVVTTEQEFYDALALDLGNKDIRVRGVIGLTTERSIGVNPIECRGVNTVQVDPETGGYASAPSFLFFNANLFFDPSIGGTINIDVFRVANEVTIEGGVYISTNLVIGGYTEAATINSSNGVKININTFKYQHCEDVLFDPTGTVIQDQFSNPDQLNYVYVSTLQQLNLALRNSPRAFLGSTEALDIYISKEISENETLLVSGSENKVIRGKSLSILSLNITNGINIDFHNDIDIGTIDTQGTIRAKTVLGNTTVNTGNFEYEYASGVVSGIGATQDFWSNTNKLNEASVSAIVSANLGNIPQEINLDLDSSQSLSKYSKYFNFGTTFDSTSLFINIDSFPSNSFVSINLRRVRGNLVQNTGNNFLTNPSNAVVTLNSLITTHITQSTDKFQINFSFIGATTRDEVISLSTL